MERLLTPEEVANLIGVSRRHVYRLLQSGALVFVRVGARKIGIRPSELETWTQKRTVDYNAGVTGKRKFEN